MVPCPCAGTGAAPARAPRTASVMRLDPSTLPAATAWGGRACTRLPSGAMIVTGANAPADAGMSGSVATRTAKYTAERVTAALRIILADDRVKAVLINIFGGITRCDEVAKGIIEAINTLNVKVPFVVRLVGTNEKEGRALLADADLITATTLADAADKAVAAAKGEIS